MKHINILGFGSGDKGEITLRTLETLQNSDKVFVRTTRHPASVILEEYHIAYDSFDDIYDKAADFDEVYQTIADTILHSDAENICYIVPGSAIFAERSVQNILHQAACDVTIIPAVSFLDAIFSTLKQDALDSFKLIDALQLEDQKPDVTCTNIICQIYSKEVASDVKLALMESYNDDVEVLMITAASTAQEVIEALPLYEIDRTENINHLTTLVVPKQTYRDAPASFDSLKEIVAELRSEHGCDWDKAQTHESLTRYLIEESYEVIDAIDENDDDHLCEELGDVLLQVLLHAQIASEAHTFSISDVIRNVSEKMLRRHPHVFGDEDSDQDLTQLWERVKQEEKAHQNTTDKLISIAKSLPSVIYAQKVQAGAAKTGFDFSSPSEAFEKITEETNELYQAMNSGNMNEISEEGGDLLFAVINVLRLCKIQSEQSLRESIGKFITRFQTMEQLIQSEQKSIEQLKAKELDLYWNHAKNMQK